MSVEMDSFSMASSVNDLVGAGGDAEVGDLVDSDFEAERLSNLEEEDQDLDQD